MVVDCSGSDLPVVTDGTTAAEPEHVPGEVAVVAGCTSLVALVVEVDEICARCCPDRYQDQQSEEARTIPAVVARADCGSDGGAVCFVTSWKRSVMWSKWTIVATSCNQDR